MAQPLNGIPLGERYRASRMHSSAGQHGKAEVLGDCGSRLAARQACEQAAGQLLGWHEVPVAGMEGAEVTMAGLRSSTARSTGMRRLLPSTIGRLRNPPLRR